MITYMYDIICVTNRKLCREDFLTRIEKICDAGVSRIIFREKDLSENDYEVLAAKVIERVQKFNTPITLHTFENAAVNLKCRSIHMPLSNLDMMNRTQYFTQLGVSVHSVSQAISAEKSGCTYITAGHIFDTDCKKGLPGRGLDFLKSVTESVNIPVYAIGGINSGNISDVIERGAAGVCIMSGLMECDDPKTYLKIIKRGETYR